MADVRVLGYCPSCGQDTLFVAEKGGAMLCQHFGCAEPTAAHDILRDRQTQHVLHVTEHGWTLRHPLIERIDDRLMSCEACQMVEDLDVLPEPGRYRMTLLGTEMRTEAD